MLAVVEKTYSAKFGKPLSGARIAIYGATGVVGTAAGVIGALEGADVTFVGHDGTTRVERHAAEVKRRFGVAVAAADGATPEGRRAILGGTDIALCAARAGVRVLGAADVEAAPNLRIAADVNAVPPLGVEGVELNANGAPLGSHGAVAIGALAIGNVKYRTEFRAVQTDDRERETLEARLPSGIRAGARVGVRLVLSNAKLTRITDPREGIGAAAAAARRRTISTPTAPSMTSSLRGDTQPTAPARAPAPWRRPPQRGLRRIRGDPARRRCGSRRE